MGNGCKVDVKIFKYASFNRIGESIITGILGCKVINKNAVLFRVNDPIFTNAGSAVFKKLRENLFVQEHVAAQNIIEIHESSQNADDPQPLHRISSIGGAVGRLLAEKPEVRTSLEHGKNTNFYRAYMPDSCVENGRTERSVWHNVGTWRETVTFYVPDGYDYDKLEKLFLQRLEYEIPMYPWVEQPKNFRKFMMEALQYSGNYALISQAFKDFAKSANIKSLCLGIGAIGVPLSYSPGPIWESGRNVGGKVVKETNVPLRFPSVLLLGDTELQTVSVGTKLNAEVIYEEMQKSGFHNIGSALVPHHGSCHNMNAPALQVLQNIGIWVVSYGRNGPFGHPNKMPCELFGIHYNVLSNTKPDDDTFCFDTDRQIYYISDPKDPEGRRLINGKAVFHCNDDNAVVLHLTHV